MSLVRPSRRTVVGIVCRDLESTRSGPPDGSPRYCGAVTQRGCNSRFCLAVVSGLACVVCSSHAAGCPRHPRTSHL
ncbi:hypothetical protein FA09DRAFT_223643 [Tilletiopsis washingtonensis]|uniref:Uncharacterized protein n=1 Tax=Tilletiopsis washingtonensis TaxID=58919 RepID=A0A316ZG42_9BASI|nr:hypothetical protein FA09DRAFT_223643 [Tilletiopsis washingtonensis]PWN99243.1 hypothetical protein FA09DRAFT_223643 [Tilletiopsis washingtonensis]